MVKFSYKKYLNSLKKKLIDSLSEIYGRDLSFLEGYHFYINPKGKIQISNVNLETLKIDRVNSVGIYFGTIVDDGKFRPSMEGAQIIKPKMNYIELDDSGLKSYVTGENLFLEEVLDVKKDGKSPCLIVKYKNDYIGTVTIKENQVLNYLSKGKRLDFNRVF